MYRYKRNTNKWIYSFRPKTHTWTRTTVIKRNSNKCIISTLCDMWHTRFENHTYTLSTLTQTLCDITHTWTLSKRQGPAGVHAENSIPAPELRSYLVLLKLKVVSLACSPVLRRGIIFFSPNLNRTNINATGKVLFEFGKNPDTLMAPWTENHWCSPYIQSSLVNLPTPSANPGPAGSAPHKFQFRISCAAGRARGRFFGS